MFRKILDNLPGAKQRRREFAVESYKLDRQINSLIERVDNLHKSVGELTKECEEADKLFAEAMREVGNTAKDLFDDINEPEGTVIDFGSKAGEAQDA